MLGKTFLLLSVLAAACSGGVDEQAPEIVRPVTAVTIEDATPPLPGQLTGLAQPYREEQVGFEVGGRVALVRDIGLEVVGPTLDAAGAVLAEGDANAWQDSTRYELALEAAQLAYESSRKELEAQVVEVETVAQSQLDQARAEEAVAQEEINRASADEELARRELERQRQLLADGVVSESAFDKAQRDHDGSVASLEAARNTLTAAQAAVSGAEDRIELLKAQIEKTRAILKEHENGIAEAQTNLDDCTLLAPFSGRITERHVGRGGFVGAGSPVVTLTMMDPIEVVVMASAEDSRRLVAGDQVVVRPRDLARFSDQDALYGVVFDKAEVADSATRTFKIEVILRNVRRQPYQDVAGTSAAAIDRVMPVLAREAGGGGPLYVHPTSILRRDGAVSVLRLPGVKMGVPRERDLQGILEPEEVPVTLVEEFFTIAQSFQRIADGSGLEAGDIVIADPRGEHLDGAVMSEYEWAVRPGDIIPVAFDLGDAPRGFYVPSEAIATLNGETSVFVVGDDGRAKRVPVSVHETVGLQRRIEGEGLASGVRVVLDGVHYVVGGERVRVVTRLGN